MLSELRIHNFAIIDDLTLKFGPGLTTFTGETGAGKSIIIDALETLLGNRVDLAMIRSETEFASIEGEFQLAPQAQPAVHAILARESLLDDPNYVVLAREIRRQGRSVARVNGRSVSAQLLREVGELLVDVHGQSDHLSLFRVKEHLRFLDSYAGTETLLASYREIYQQLRAVRSELEALRSAEHDAARRADLLEYQINEIESAGIDPDEEGELRQERTRLANAEALARLAKAALFLLEEGEAENQPVTDLFGEVVDSLNSLERIDPSQAELAAKAQEIFEELSDLALEVRDYAENLEFNPRRLEQVEIRLDLLNNLKRKYGPSLADVLAFATRAKAQLNDITHADERISSLQGEESRLLTELARRGLALSEKRQAASQALSQAIEAELDHLRMEAAQFAVDFNQVDDEQGVLLPGGRRVAFDAHGIETIQFLVAPNPGEGLKPLVKVASGGEMSRVTLAIKNVLAQADLTPTLVFDEIDQGIGGRVGSVVGEKLWRLAQRHQVLCITHLPQLAAFGQQHYHVQKVVQHGRTSTHLEPLSGEERLRELASMLGTLSDGTRQSAQEILNQVAGLQSKA